MGAIQAFLKNQEVQLHHLHPLNSVPGLNLKKITHIVVAVFKSTDYIAKKSILLRTILQRGFNCSKDCIAPFHFGHRELHLFIWLAYLVKQKSS